VIIVKAIYQGSIIVVLLGY